MTIMKKKIQTDIHKQPIVRSAKNVNINVTQNTILAISFVVCYIRCFAYQSHIQNRLAMHHCKIIIQESQTVTQYAGNYDIYLLYVFIS